MLFCWAKNQSNNFGHILHVFDPINTGKNKLVTLLKKWKLHGDRPKRDNYCRRK